MALNIAFPDRSPTMEISAGHLSIPPFDIKGQARPAKVSAAGNVYRGEFIKIVHELERVDELRFALEGVSILDTAPLGGGRVGVVFAREGSTWFKIIKHDGELMLGNTLQLVDEPLERAMVVGLSDTLAAVLYNADAAGQVAVVKLTDRAAELAYTDVWDVEDPVNITAAALDGSRILAGGVRQPEGKAHYTTITLGAAAATVAGDCLLAAEYDDDEYARGWALTALGDSVAVASYFHSHNEPVGLAVLDVLESGPTVRWTGKCVYLGALPCVSLTSLGSGLFAAVNGLARVDATGNVVKTALACEIWRATEFGALPCWYAVEGTDYDVNVGLASVLPTKSGLTLSYSADGVAKSMLVDLSARGPEGGPSVGHGNFGNYCRAVPINNTYAVLVTQRDGNGYAAVMRRVETVISAEGEADGVAKTGGGPGSTITIVTDAE